MARLLGRNRLRAGASPEAWSPQQHSKFPGFHTLESYTQVEKLLRSGCAAAGQWYHCSPEKQSLMQLRPPGETYD
jgi:hypothetical protein